jgi:hypothetical protein
VVPLGQRNHPLSLQVRQSMARIKSVLSERQHIYKTFKREQILALVRPYSLLGVRAGVATTRSAHVHV